MAEVELRYKKMPSVLATYPKSFVGRKPALIGEGRTVPSMEAGVSGVVADSGKVGRYNQVCGFKSGENMPIAYPHILAMPLQLHLIVHPAFPVRAMGLVHIENTITQHGTIPVETELGIRCFLEGHRESSKGQAFDMRTEVSSKDSIIWEESSIYLARRRSKGKSTADKAPADPAQDFDRPGTVSSGWNAPAGLGRQYAKVSGDFNPIHLSDATARMLGFKAAIGHGMWSLARSLAEIGDDSLGPRVRVEAAFKLPIFLPSWLTFLSHAANGHIDFLLSDNAGRKPHLSGVCTQF